MKYLLSIPLIILILFTGINVKIATHYCGGYISGTKISLTGKLATCGMQHSSAKRSLAEVYNTRCCEDFMTTYSICNNYFPSAYSTDNSEQRPISVFYVACENSADQQKILNKVYTNIRPPGSDLINHLSPSALCVYRI